jgi:hypothetical protein
MTFLLLRMRTETVAFKIYSAYSAEVWNVHTGIAQFIKWLVMSWTTQPPWSPLTPSMYLECMVLNCCDSYIQSLVLRHSGNCMKYITVFLKSISRAFQNTLCEILRNLIIFSIRRCSHMQDICYLFFWFNFLRWSTCTFLKISHIKFCKRPIITFSNIFRI